MRIRPYVCQLTRWIILLQLTFVALVPIPKKAIDNIAAVNLTSLDEENGAKSSDKELRQSEEVRYKRQIDDSDDEFKPRPSDLVKQEANIDAHAFFYPMKNNTIEDTKLDTSGSRINYVGGHLEKVKKPDIDNTLIPLYDEDVDSDLDPLSGILDPKYWEEGDDASAKVINFFEKTPMGSVVGFKSEDITDKELNNKDVNPCDKGNTDQNLYEEKSSCYSNSQLPNHFLNKPKTYERNYKYKKDDNKLHTSDRRKFGKKIGKASTDEETVDTNPQVIDPVDENNGEYMHIQNILKSSQIHSGMISNLGNVLNNLVKDVVAGTIETSKDDLDNKTVKLKESEESNRDVPSVDTVNLSEEIGGGNVFNVGRRLMSINEEDEEHLDGSHNSGGSGYDRENYFAVDSNMDSSIQEQRKQSNFNIIKNAILGVRKSSNVEEDKASSDLGFGKTLSNVVEDGIPFENVMNGLDGNFSGMRKRNVLGSQVRFPRKNRRRQVNLQRPLEDNRQEALLLEERELGKLNVKESTEKAGESSTHHVTSTSTSSVSLSSGSGNHNSTGKGEHGQTTTLPTNVTENITAQTVDYEDELSSIELSNKVVDAIFAQAQARGDMRNSLGICRKSGDLKNLKGSKMVEDKSDSIVEEIMRCVSSLLKGHEQKTMCLTLDDSLNEFLRWLLLTGESMHGKGFVAQKPDRDKSEFLFPSICAGDSASESGSSQKPKIQKSSYS